MASAPTTLVGGLSFPEGPRWHDGALWWSDIRRGTVQRVTLDGVVTQLCAVAGGPSGLGFLPDGTPLVVSMRDRVVLRILPSGRTELHADLSGVPGGFLNDMLVDGDGRAYVDVRTPLEPGVQPLDRRHAADRIAVVEPDGTVAIAASDVLSPNGMVLSDDGATLVLAETYAQRLVAFERRLDGSLHAPRVFADLPGRYPDGICAGADGTIWVGSPYSDEFVRVADGGEVLERIALAGGVACARGGLDGDLLFLCCVDPRSLQRPGGRRPASLPIEEVTGGQIAVASLR